MRRWISPLRNLLVQRPGRPMGWFSSWFCRARFGTYSSHFLEIWRTHPSQEYLCSGHAEKCTQYSCPGFEEFEFQWE